MEHGLSTIKTAKQCCLSTSEWGANGPSKAGPFGDGEVCKCWSTERAKATAKDVARPGLAAAGVLLSCCWTPAGLLLGAVVQHAGMPA
eukprot:1136900-Pelagomonas_calceolata.AAC.3